MEQQVWSLQRARRSTLRPRVAVCSPHGRLRTVEGGRSELTLLLHMIEALDCAAIPHTLKPIHQHIDAMVVPFAHAEAIAAALQAVVPHEA